MLRLGIILLVNGRLKQDRAETDCQIATLSGDSRGTDGGNDKL